MSDKKIEQAAAGGPAGAVSEEKRRAARRRFLTRSAAGSGVMIVTLFHQRSAMAGGGTPSTTVYTSSVEFCASLKGHTTTGKTVAIPDPNNPKQNIAAYECSGVPEYKVPWAPGGK